MSEKFLLYIDILGFRELVRRGSSCVDDLYKVIASLNLHRHHAFRAIVFSDTVLVYNIDGGDSIRDCEYLVMFLCEFAQDLQIRLADRGIMFRAVIVHGEFHHYTLKSIPCFYGPALIQAYDAEKQIKAIGLFLNKSISHYNTVFKTIEFNDNYDFVFVTQLIDEIEDGYHAEFPMDKYLLIDADMIYHLVPEIMHLKYLYSRKSAQNDDRVRQKYTSTWRLMKKRYPLTTSFLEQNSFTWKAICPDIDWDTILKKYPKSYSY